MVDELICNEDKSLLEAVSYINDNGHGVIFVVDENLAIKGILTDGDIRRLLLEGVEFHEAVGKHAMTSFTAARVGDDISSVLDKISEKIKIVPILNEKDEVVDFYNVPQKINLPVAIPQLNGNEFKYLVDAFLSTWISSSGEYIRRFERDFASFLGVEHGVAVSNGTVALHLALVALGVGEGDEVIVPDLTFAATINAVLHAGATPVIVDVEADSWCLGPDAIEAALTNKTKAIIPVHIYGQACDMDSIMSIAKANDLVVIEDCAEAHGAEWKGRKVGSFGDVSCFSFFANKIITTGEGGMCLTDSTKLNERMCKLRDHGMSKEKRYWHEEVGFNYRMTNLQAAIGCAQLEEIDAIEKRKFAIEATYRNALKGIDGVEFQSDRKDDVKRVIWLVCILIEADKRNDVLSRLKEKGIDARPFFYPMSDMPVYQEYLNCANPNTRRLSAQGINLPSSVLPTEVELEAIKSVLTDR